jgi:hypothetical protein
VVKAWNDDEIQGYADLVRIGQPDFIEVKVGANVFLEEACVGGRKAPAYLSTLLRHPATFSSAHTGRHLLRQLKGLEFDHE